jgi:uncharacterized protein
MAKKYFVATLFIVGIFIVPMTAYGHSKLIKVPWCRQENTTYCGPAAMQSLIYYYFANNSKERFIHQDTLAKELETGEEGTPFCTFEKVAKSHGLKAKSYHNMGLHSLKSHLDRGRAVICSIQAWRDFYTPYKHDWDDGHFVIAIGYDKKNIYFMDPSVLGNYTFIPIHQFLKRWHDLDVDGVTKLIQSGVVIWRDKPEEYIPRRIRRTE